MGDGIWYLFEWTGKFQDWISILVPVVSKPFRSLDVVGA